MTDNSKAAATGAQKLCEAIEESGEVALIVPDSVSENAKERVSAFEQEISGNHAGSCQLWRRSTWIRSIRSSARLPQRNWE